MLIITTDNETNFVSFQLHIFIFFSIFRIFSINFMKIPSILLLKYYFVKKKQSFHTSLQKTQTYIKIIIEPPHDKTNKMTVCSVKTQISLGIRTVWSESSLSAWRNLGSLATHWAHSQDWSDWADAKANLSVSWANGHFVGFVMGRLNWVLIFLRRWLRIDPNKPCQELDCQEWTDTKTFSDLKYNSPKTVWTLNDIVLL